MLTGVLSNAASQAPLGSSTHFSNCFQKSTSLDSKKKFREIYHKSPEQQEISRNRTDYPDTRPRPFRARLVTHGVRPFTLRVTTIRAPSLMHTVSANTALIVAQHQRRPGAVWMMSAKVSICWSPNIAFSIEKTRSAAAEFGVKAKTICAASAHAGVSSSLGGMLM
jgi:hypothetical protein